MTSVFIVRGTTGEYSDREEWTVRAFATHAEAEAFLVRCQAYLARKPQVADEGSEEDLYDLIEKWKASHPLDSQFSHSYTGTEYHVEEVPFGPSEAA